jgi:hypothetical protein
VALKKGRQEGITQPGGQVNLYSLTPGTQFKFRPGDPIQIYLGNGYYFDVTYRRKLLMACDTLVIVIRLEE